MIVEIPYRMRRQFRPLHASRKRWAVAVAHRRAGKTVACINHLLRDAIRCPHPEPRLAYVAPFSNQAKDVAWSYLKHFAGVIPGLTAMETELRVDLPNGGRVRLYGADNADRLRGLYLDGVVLDEYGDMAPRVWPEVIRPTLADREGWAIFIGTPRGRNHFADQWQRAGSDPDYLALMLKASETGILKKAELEAARAEMTPAQYAAEFECSFDAAVPGAYYAAEFERIAETGRITRVPWDPAQPVTTAWDLGVGDSTAIWFAQRAGREVHLIDYAEASGVGLDHYAKLLSEKPYAYEQHLLPHDAMARELGTGLTRIEMLQRLGLTPTVLKAQSVEDGINAARLLLASCWFDAENCAEGLAALRQYRSEFDELRSTFRPRPRHDWTSHAADAFRYLALGWKRDGDGWDRKLENDVRWVV